MDLTTKRNNKILVNHLKKEIITAKEELKQKCNNIQDERGIKYMQDERFETFEYWYLRGLETSIKILKYYDI